MVAPTSKNTQDATTAQEYCVTIILGNITPETVDDLEEELGEYQ